MNKLEKQEFSKELSNALLFQFSECFFFDSIEFIEENICNQNFNLSLTIFNDISRILLEAHANYQSVPNDLHGANEKQEFEEMQVIIDCIEEICNILFNE
jgi:hypothetical protein